jgi:hypothetical protein
VKGRVLALGLLLALFAAFLTRGAGPGPAPPPIEPVPAGSVSPVEPPVAIPPPEPARDPFQYLDDSAFRVHSPPPAREPKVEVVAEPPPAPLRLLGFVRRGDALLAALSLYGVVVTAGAGESAEGYQVLAVDEDAGVRLRGPDGAEVVLGPPPE